jgi:hypothetical protein
MIAPLVAHVSDLDLPIGRRSQHPRERGLARRLGQPGQGVLVHVHPGTPELVPEPFVVSGDLLEFVGEWAGDDAPDDDELP